MHTTAAKYFIAVLFASRAFGQDQDRVLRFANTESAQSIQEIATVIRFMTEMDRMSADTAQRSLAVRGTSSQIALAEWLFGELDRSKDQSPVTREYRVPGGGEDLVRVFYLTNASTPVELQEVATLVRSMSDIRRLFTYNAPRALVVRTTSGQMALAEWLIKELDKSRSPKPDTSEYRLPGGGDDIVRVFYLTHAGTPQRLQEIATQVRSMTAVRRLFTYNAPKAMALRGTADQMAQAEHLIKERDQ